MATEWADPWKRLRIGRFTWSVRLCPRLIFTHNAEALTCYNEHDIFIDASLGPRKRMRALLHELGHIIGGELSCARRRHTPDGYTPHWRNHHRLLCPTMERLEPLLKALVDD